jgi:apolipoprotein N-acyltransferase
VTFSWLFGRIAKSDDIKSLLAEVFFFFFCLHIACLYWVAYPLTLDLAVHGMLIPVALVLIPSYLSTFLLAPAWVLANKFAAAHSLFNQPIAFASLFSLTMMFYGNFLPGFPWVLPGYIWCCHEIFLQTLSIWGIHGLGFVTMLISGFCGQSFLHYELKDLKKAKISAVLSIFIFAAMVLFGCVRLANNPTTFTDKKIRIIQCNIPQKNKNDSNLAFQNFKEHLLRSRHESKIDLIIWPEASIPYLYHENFKQLHDYLKSFLQKSEYLLAGAVRKDLRTKRIYNSVVLINHCGENIGNYDKSRLLPFGEYVPFRKYITFRSIASTVEDFDVGESAKIFEVDGVKIIFAICYEIVFPNGFVPKETSAGRFFRSSCLADLIINLTNDGWFGFTTEPFQHLQITRARAIETGLPVIRATNYGISAVFDPCGRELAQIPINQSGVLDINIPHKMHSVFYNLEQKTLLFILLILSLWSSIMMFFKKQSKT